MNKEECIVLLEKIGDILAKEHKYGTKLRVKKDETSKHPISLVLEDETGEDWTSEIHWFDDDNDKYHRITLRFRFSDICLSVRTLTIDNQEVLSEISYGKPFNVVTKQYDNDEYHLKLSQSWGGEEGVNILHHMFDLTISCNGN